MFDDEYSQLLTIKPLFGRKLQRSFGVQRVGVHAPTIAAKACSMARVCATTSQPLQR